MYIAVDQALLAEVLPDAENQGKDMGILNIANTGPQIIAPIVAGIVVSIAGFQLVFGMAVLFVFLVLAAQFESLILPLSIILIVPMCLLAAMAGVHLRGMDNNVLTQIGLVVLIALAAKNAILIVEFARQDEAKGMSTIEAAVRAAHDRLRPILMTSFAFIFGVMPLAISTGAGANSRIAIGTAVIGGMLTATALAIFYIPFFFVLVRRSVRDGLKVVRERIRQRREANA